MTRTQRFNLGTLRQRLSTHAALPALIAPWIGPVCLLAIFAGVLSGRDRLAFRDVGYFYTPLYQYVAEQCHGQSWGAFGNALWNPADQTGMPLAGETTTAVFYPLRMLVYAPAWSAEIAMGVYVVLHLVIASLAAYLAARRFRCDPAAAAVAGVVYPLSGMVLFLATNPPFLVGAAWLPLLLTPLIDWRTTLRFSGVGVCARHIMRSADDHEPQHLDRPRGGFVFLRHATQIPWWRAAVVPAIAMAMILLGGDPPTALHAMILAVVVQASQLGREWWRGLRPPNELLRISSAILIQMVTIVLLASVLAAPQLAASLAWSARSDRVQHEGVSGTAKIHAEAYAFSVPPWRFAELLAPNLYGSPWPTNTRWDRLVFDGGRTRLETALWTPTLYSGMLPPLLFVLLLVGWSRRTPSAMVTLSRDGMAMLIILALSMAAAMGAYGPLYRGLHEFLPGYDSLRYPAKWLPFAAFALVIWSAKLVRRDRVKRQYDKGRSTIDEPGYPTHILVWVLVAIGFVLASVLGATAIGRLQGRVSDPFWGPFVPELANYQFLFSMGSVLVAVALMAGRRRSWWWVVWVAVDLGVAHCQLVPTIERAAESRLLTGQQNESSEIRWMRVIQDGGYPQEWSEQSDGDRMLTVEAGLRRARFGRWHLEHGDAVVNNLVSIGTRELAEFWYHAKSMDRVNRSLPEHHWRGWCRLLGVGGLLRCRGGDLAAPSTTAQHVLPAVTWEPLNGAESVMPDKLSIRRRVDAIDTDRAAAWRKLLEEYADERAGVAARIPLRIWESLHSQSETEGITSAVLSRHVYQDGNWSATLTPLDTNSPPQFAEVFPLDFLSQGVLCPSGRWRIEFIYAPWWHRPVLLLAAIGWLAITLGYLVKRTRIAMRRRSLLHIRQR
ncbi:hypothetical protein [Allorhodopirellula heiligendammensis]|uniref:Bacterial membrane protein YfhO n=1 Tax=Allorhodopirellula heiligendammensis TaxID=2714739 RepID=A0A5C6BX42_9BACT|nr:hypothetical protein [Allorhodopirellula heiligendammensis]TWU15846.1 hypothetical protein Poly21_30480 [Allorhodopirellula heiligendammensis]